jgi:cellulose biosynthesis protein BcsQ
MSNRQTEIIVTASGKGGTGKTLLLASLGYALQRSGHKVLFVDADTATDGLSLFLLGPRGWEQAATCAGRPNYTTGIRSI